MKKFSLTFILVWISYLSASAQYHQTLYWVRYQNQMSLSPTLSWINEIDNRRFIDPDVQNQLIIHSRLHVKKGKWDFAGGVTSSWAYASRPETGYKNSVHELRPVIEISHEQPINKLLLHQRLRIDNRFFQTDPSQSVFEESLFVMRWRYRLQIKIPVAKNKNDVTSISVKAAEEIMFNHIKNTFDQNRLYVSAEFMLTKNIALETGYIYIYQQRFGYEDIFSRHVLRFSLLHRIKVY